MNFRYDSHHPTRRQPANENLQPRFLGRSSREGFATFAWTGSLGLPNSGIQEALQLPCCHQDTSNRTNPPKGRPIKRTTVFQHFTLQRAADPWDRETGTFMSLVIAAIDAWGLELIIEFHSQKYELATRCN